MDTKYIKYVADYQPTLLSRPTPKMEKSETINELPIILVDTFKITEK